MSVSFCIILVGHPRLLPKAGKFPKTHLQNEVQAGQVIYHYNDHKLGTKQRDFVELSAISN